MIELNFEYIQAEALQFLELLDSKETVLFSEDNCLKIQLSDDNVTIEVLSNRGKGYTNVFLHPRKILDDDPDLTVIIGSPSTDTDIVILITGFLHQYRERVILMIFTETTIENHID